MSETGNSTPLPGDNPIENREGDVLERADLAVTFTRQVLELDASRGATVGVFGPWGSGKTSFVNLARQTFESEGVPVLDFNPWLFSGAEQLVKRFIAELSMELKLRDLEAVGKALEGYGDALSGLSGKTGKDREGTRTAKEVVEAMVGCLFPAGARLRQMSGGDSESHANEDAAEHLKERRVAHEHVLRLYLEGVVSPDLLAFHDAERALDRMTDRVASDEFIRSLEPARWQDVVSNLCELADRFRPEHVEPGIVVVLNLWPDMPERPSGSSVLGNDTRSIVRRTTYRLLHSLEDTAAVEAAVRHILPLVTSLSSKVELVLLVGHREKSEHKLVSETVAYEFENMLRYEIRAAPADGLAEERDPLRALVFAKHCGWPTEEPFEMDDSPKLTFALLRSTRWEAATASSGALSVTFFPALGPETLVDLHGGKEVLETRISDLKAGFDTLKPWLETRRIPLDEAEQLLDMADRYLSGSRPDAD